MVLRNPITPDRYIHHPHRLHTRITFADCVWEYFAHYETLGVDQLTDFRRKAHETESLAITSYRKEAMAA